MFSIRPIGWISLAVMALACVPARGQYDVLVNFNDIRVGAQYNILGGTVIEGSTMYAVVRGIESVITPEWESQITKVENFAGSPTTTVLVSNATWKAFTGGDEAATILPGNRMMVKDGYLQFLDTSADGIYRVDTNTGALSLYVSTNAVKAVTGAASASFIDAVATSPDGRMAFYDQVSDHILVVADSNGVPEVSILVSAEDMVLLYGSSPINLVAGGMTFDCAGNLYWTLSQSGSTGSAGGSIYRRDAVDGTLSLVLAEIEIQLATLLFGNVGFNDLYAAPDGNLYFYDRNADAILYFHPDDPTGTLTVYLSEAQLNAGPALNDFVGEFSAYGRRLIWNHIVASSPNVYAKDLVVLPGDFDGDGAIDGADAAAFADCLAGPAAEPAPTAGGVTVDDCLAVFDTDCDSDVDLRDFAQFQFIAGQ